MDWIDVKKELPKGNVKVIVYHKFENGGKINMADYYENPKYSHKGWDCFMADFITHWMPLPNKP